MPSSGNSTVDTGVDTGDSLVDQAETATHVFNAATVGVLQMSPPAWMWNPQGQQAGLHLMRRLQASQAARVDTQRKIAWLPRERPARRRAMRVQAYTTRTGQSIDIRMGWIAIGGIQPNRGAPQTALSGHRFGIGAAADITAANEDHALYTGPVYRPRFWEAADVHPALPKDVLQPGFRPTEFGS